MNVALGLGGMAVLFWYAAAAHDSVPMMGVFHVPALALLVLGPWCAALVAWPTEQLVATVRHLARAMRFRTSHSRQLLFLELTAFAAEIRARRHAAALEVADRAEHELVRQLAPLLVKQYGPEALEQTAATAAQCLSSSVRRSEAVLSALARAAPAMGLVGTVLGLVKLLRSLNDYSQLGPSLALALLCTLYGLVLANAVYQPLARRLQTWNAVLLEEARLLTRALTLLSEGRPLADARTLFESAAGEPEAPEVLAAEDA
jgi:chemotaxis protein MotA